jgi:MarR family transcriptional regulator, organic hydroperoxide resistance regulator
VIEHLSDEIPAAMPGMSLDEQLCFALYAASRAMTGCYRPGLDEVGLTYPQYLVMLVLWEHRSVSVNQLSDRLQLSTGTLSPLLKRLEAAGLLERRRRTDDERQVQLTVTDAGMALQERTNTARSAVETASGMSRSEIARMRDELTELTERLRTAVRPGPPG